MLLVSPPLPKPAPTSKQLHFSKFNFNSLTLCDWHRSSEATHTDQQCRKSPFHSLSMYNIDCGSWDMQQCWPLLPCLQASLWRNPPGEQFPFQNSCKTVKNQALTLLRGFRVFPFMIVYPSLSYRPISAKQFCVLEQPFLIQCLFSFSVLKRTKQRASWYQNEFFRWLMLSVTWTICQTLCCLCS